MITIAICAILVAFAIGLYYAIRGSRTKEYKPRYTERFTVDKDPYEHFSSPSSHVGSHPFRKSSTSRRRSEDHPSNINYGVLGSMPSYDSPSSSSSESSSFGGYGGGHYGGGGSSGSWSSSSSHSSHSSSDSGYSSSDSSSSSSDCGGCDGGGGGGD